MAMAIRDHLNGLWNDEDFEKWYPRDGRPGLTPAQLATVSVLPFPLELSDRQAAESVRDRIDFKYTLGTEPEDPGLHHSVLTGFRERLAGEGRGRQAAGPRAGEDPGRQPGPGARPAAHRLHPRPGRPHDRDADPSSTEPTSTRRP